MPFPFPVGRIRADELNEALNSGRVIARGERQTNGTALGAEQAVLRIDNVPLLAGRLYWIGTNTVSLDTSVANDIARVQIRIDVTGAAATTASTLMALSQVRLADAAAAEDCGVSFFYSAATDLTLSVLLCTTRAGGTGLIGILGSASIPIHLFVIDCGEDPGDTGVDL